MDAKGMALTRNRSGCSNDAAVHMRTEMVPASQVELLAHSCCSELTAAEMRKGETG